MSTPRYLVVLPSFNSGVMLARTVGSVLKFWSDVLVVIDGSDDDSERGLPHHSGLTVLRRSRNGGKGTAVFDGLEFARSAGFTHVVVMDADGQHDAACILPFIANSRLDPSKMILGTPRFGPDAPSIRVWGRKIANFFSGWLGADRIDDCLFGFRIYPVDPLWYLMSNSRSMRGFDFDPEAAIRLSWCGVKTWNVSVPVRYYNPNDGGVSHFHYGRDNLLLTIMFMRLAFSRFKPCRH